MKKTIEKTELKNDFFNFACWKTASLIKSKFNSNTTSFYDTFTKWSNLKTLNGDEYGKAWQNIRLVNEFLSVDTVLVKIITKKTYSVVDDLVQEKKIKKFKNGTLRWTNKAGEKKEQQFKCRYVPDKSEFEKHPLSWWLSFKQNDFSPRLKKLIGKYFEKTSPEQQQLVEYICEQLEKEESIDMTKKQEEQYQKEYEEGKHLLSLEEYEKDQAKKKRRADKRALTIATKAANASITNYAKLVTENNQLKADNSELKEKVQALEEEVRVRDEKIKELTENYQKLATFIKAHKEKFSKSDINTPAPQTQTQTQPQTQPQIQTPSNDIPDVDKIAQQLNEKVNHHTLTYSEATEIAPFYGVSSSALAESDYKSLDIYHMSTQQKETRRRIFFKLLNKFGKSMDKDTRVKFQSLYLQAKTLLTPHDGMGPTQAALVKKENDHQFHMSQPSLTDEEMMELVQHA